jgi:hypothetical protein
MRTLGLLALLAAGCSGTIVDDDFHGAEGEAEQGLMGTGTVGDKVTGSCSTATVAPLSKQIAEEVACLAPGALAPFVDAGGIHFTSAAVLPFLHPTAIVSLQAAARESGDLRINSAFRTVAQQYLLHRWYQTGRCSIPAAATPGTSNHEGGRAIDLADWSMEVSVMSRHGFAHDVPGDNVHFDHLKSSDIRGLDVHAFQRLWNRNHPEDRIDEDGDYGPLTAARLANAPAGGFPLGADCS